MGIVNTLTASKILALDTNIFIYAYQKSDIKGQVANRFLERVKRVAPRVFISVLVFEEFLVRIYKENLEKNLAYYEDFLTQRGLISVVDIDRTVARKAASLRANYPSIKTPDALHLASALASKAHVFVTTDKRLPKKIGSLNIESI